MIETTNTCINVCKITGSQESITQIDKALDIDFSMNSLVPISKYADFTDRIEQWGCEEDMELMTYINCSFSNPQSIDMAYLTDVPNLLFLRKVSLKYRVTIEHSFYDATNKYVGYNKVINGSLVDFEYEENETSEEYEALKSKYNFEDVDDIVEEPKQTIISMKDLLKLKK